MKQNYKKLGEIVELIDERNKSLVSTEVLGISIDKEFMPSVANTIGTDLSNYKLISKNIFACNPMHVGRDERLPVSLYLRDKLALVSPAYFMFRIKDENEVMPEFLMLLFKRDEFDRNCWFRTDGSVRGGITWEDICEIRLPVPDIKEQQKIVDTYNAITKRIQIKKKINENILKNGIMIVQNCVGNAIYSNQTDSEIEEIKNNLPENQKLMTIKEFCRNTKSGSTPSRTENVYWKNGNIPWKYETINNFFSDKWRTKWLESMKNDKTMLEMECDEPLCKNKVPREGVVIRKCNDKVSEAFKLKSAAHYNIERKQHDKGETDMEETN